MVESLSSFRYLPGMDNVDLQVMRQVVAWQASGHRVVLGTITRTWGSAPRPPGSSVAIRDDGLVAGSVSGGCIEDDLVDKARGGVLAAGVPQVVRYGIDADAAHRFGLPCGGLIELVMEPVQPITQLPELLSRLTRGERVRRHLTLATGAVRLEDGHVDGDAAGLRLRQLVLVSLASVALGLEVRRGLEERLDVARAQRVERQVLVVRHRVVDRAHSAATSTSIEKYTSGPTITSTTATAAAASRIIRRPSPSMSS